MKKRTKALMIMIAVILSLTIGIVPEDTHASSKKVKKMTAYKLIKTGNIVYCQNGMYVYKVNIKTKKVNRLAWKGSVVMKKKGRYLYCVDHITGGRYGKEIIRIDTKTKKKKKLAIDVVTESVAIKGKRIYYSTLKYNNVDNSEKVIRRIMKLNGKGRKKTKYKGKLIVKKANTKGYRVWNDYKPGSYDEWPLKANHYLKTPRGDIFLDYTWLN